MSEIAPIPTTDVFPLAERHGDLARASDLLGRLVVDEGLSEADESLGAEEKPVEVVAAEGDARGPPAQPGHVFLDAGDELGLLCLGVCVVETEKGLAGSA